MNLVRFFNYWNLGSPIAGKKHFYTAQNDRVHPTQHRPTLYAQRARGPRKYESQLFRSPLLKTLQQYSDRLFQSPQKPTRLRTAHHNSTSRRFNKRATRLRRFPLLLPPLQKDYGRISPWMQESVKVLQTNHSLKFAIPGVAVMKSNVSESSGNRP